MAKNCRNSDAEPVANPRWRNSRGSSSGSSVRSSTQHERREEHDAADEPDSVSGSVQPRSGPSMMPSTSRPIPSAESTAPRGSRPTCSSTWCGHDGDDADERGAASPAVTRKIEPHQNCSSSAPDTRMPSVPPAPAKPAQMPTALARSSGGNTLVMVDSVPGMRSAAPRPVSARSAMRRSRRADERRRAPTRCRRGRCRRSARRGARTGRRARRRGAAARRAPVRRRRRSTAATTGWRRGRRRCSAARWRASRRRRRPSPGPGTSRRGSGCGA